MRFKQNGEHYKYYAKIVREKQPYGEKDRFYVNLFGFVKQDGVWKKCRYYLLTSSKRWVLEINPSGTIKDGVSNLGVIPQVGYFKRLKLSRINQARIGLLNIFFSLKISLLKFLDRLLPIQTNLILIGSAICIAVIYFFINYFCNDLLQKLIAESNIAQSFIVFLSVSSIINMFHPFTFRKELSESDVDFIAKRENDKTQKAKDFEKYTKQDQEW